MVKDPNIVIAGLVIASILGRAAMQRYLEARNRASVLAHKESVPAALAGAVPLDEYRKSIDYSLAKASFSRFEIVFDTLLLLFWLFSGVLPALYERFLSIGTSVWIRGAYLLAAALLMSVPSLPLSWYWQFKVEERFGFNRTTLQLWIVDRIKGLFLGLIIGLPLLALLLKIVEWAGNAWWLWAWAVMLVFQVIMMILAPMLIVPLFNKLTPLPEGDLKTRLLDLGRRVGFHAENIQVIDGSKRSTHSNAFFTGFGRFRRIVLFDTLIEQLTIPELEAVLAHEIGHYKLKHIPKLLAFSSLSLLVSFVIMGWLANRGFLARAFGFPVGDIVPVLLLFGLLAGPFTFWLEPLTNRWSRKYEYQADAYAADAVKGSSGLISALRKLNLKNLSNLTPDPLYSAFYYSHPTLLERESALTSR